MRVSLGSSQASSEAKLDKAKHVGSQIALPPKDPVNESATFKQFRDEKSDRSMRLKRENERVLRMKNKPTAPKRTFESERKARGKRFGGMRREGEERSRRGAKGPKGRTLVDYSKNGQQ